MLTVSQIIYNSTRCSRRVSTRRQVIRQNQQVRSARMLA